MQQPDLAADVRIHYVRVTNNLEVPFTDMHDGVPVKLDPGKADNLPLDMAAHFFGYYPGVDTAVMFRHVCKRQGWNTPDHIKPEKNGKSKAENMFSKLDIRPVAYKMVEVTADNDSPIPADTEELPEPRRKVGAK